MVTIRPARPEDFDAIYPLLCQLWTEKRFDKERLQAIFSGQFAEGKRFLVAVEDDSVVGFASMFSRENFEHAGRLATIDELVVDEKLRGSGVGSALIAQLEKIAKNEGSVMIELTTSTRRVAAHRFYEKCGYMMASFHFWKPL